MKWSQICQMVPLCGLTRENEIPYQIRRIRERVSGKMSIPTSGPSWSGLCETEQDSAALLHPVWILLNTAHILQPCSLFFMVILFLNTASVSIFSLFPDKLAGLGCVYTETFPDEGQRGFSVHFNTIYCGKQETTGTRLLCSSEINAFFVCVLQDFQLCIL